MSVTISGSGQIIKQVKSQSFSSQPTTTSTSYVAAGFSVSITPTNASNKILIRISGSVGTTGGAPAVSIMRNGTAISGAPYYRFQADYSWPNSSFEYTMEYLDSPATTSATSYDLCFSNPNIGGSGTTYINTNPGTYGNSQTTITLEEIAYA